MLHEICSAICFKISFQGVFRDLNRLSNSLLWTTTSQCICQRRSEQFNVSRDWLLWGLVRKFTCHV